MKNKQDEFLFVSRRQAGYLKRIKDPSLRRAVYFAALRNDHTHPDASDWHDRDEDRLNRLVAKFETLADQD